MELLREYHLGGLTLKNRMVMSAMTRNRAAGGDVPGPLAATYYTQRASAGLMVTEGSPVSPQGVGYVRTPGIYTREQVRAWAEVTAAVHRAGGLIYLQLWHVGRISHPDFHDGALPVAPSAIAPRGHAHTATGPKAFVTPRALDFSEIPAIVDQFRRGAINAKEAGFDGVELHGANGYLLDQFLRDGANQRSDAYGGSVARRARLPLEVAEAVASVWGPERVGYKISPYNPFNDMVDSDPAATFTHIARELSALRIGYLAVVEDISGRHVVPIDRRVTPALRKAFSGTFVVNSGYNADSGNAAIASGAADLVAYGASFLANPDLPERFRDGAPLNAPNPATFYGGGEAGYIDYPTAESREPIAEKPIADSREPIAEKPIADSRELIAES